MKSFKHNLTEENILLNGLIFFSFEEREEVFVRIPRIKDSVDDPTFSPLISLMFLKIEDYKKMKLRSDLEDEIDGFIAILKESKEVRLRVKPHIEKLILDSEVTLKGIEVKGRVLEKNEIKFFKEIILISFGAKKIEDAFEAQKEEDLLSKMSEAQKAVYLRQQETLKRLEQAKARRGVAKTEEAMNLSKIIVGVMKEFNMTLEEIKDLNYYTLYYLFSYIFKIDHYDFMKKAAASGNLTKKAKITHWLE